MLQFAQQRNGFQPAKAFLNALPLPLAHPITWIAAWCVHQSRCRRVDADSAPCWKNFLVWADSRWAAIMRAIRDMVDNVLAQLSGRFNGMYAKMGRTSIAPEKLLGAQLLQMLYSTATDGPSVPRFRRQITEHMTLLMIVSTHTSS
jgi:hypothetical protein